jgi:ankyrin repeat protein
LRKTLRDGDDLSEEQLHQFSTADLRGIDSDGKTLLYFAAENNCIDTVRLLLSKEVDAAKKERRLGWTALHVAAHNGHVEVVELLKDPPSKLEIDAKDLDRRTPLLLAAASGHTVVVRALIAAGADFNAKDDFDRTPLQWAVEGDHRKVLEELLKQGKRLDIEAMDIFGRSAFWRAAWRGYEDIVELLSDVQSPEMLTRTDKNHRTALHAAAENGHTRVVRTLLDNSDFKYRVGYKDLENQTALHLAAKEGRISVVRLLLAVDTNMDSSLIDARTKAGKTAEELAIDNDHERIAQLLFDERRELKRNEKNDEKSGRISMMEELAACSTSQGEAPAKKLALRVAVEEGKTEVVWQLLKEKVGVDTGTSNQKSLLHLAAERAPEEILTLLLKETKKVNVQDRNGLTPLHLAAQRGYDKVVKQLVDQGKADVDIRDRTGQTALHLAAAKGLTPVVKFLLSKDEVDADAEDRDGQTPLHLAAANGELEAVKALLEENEGNSSSGAEKTGQTAFTDAEDLHGQTALHLAAKYGHTDVVRALLDGFKSNKADINYRDHDGAIPLHLAAANDKKEVIRLLLDGKAKSYIKDDFGNPALSTHQDAKDTQDSPEQGQTEKEGEEEAPTNDIAGKLDQNGQTEDATAVDTHAVSHDA